MPGAATGFSAFVDRLRLLSRMTTCAWAAERTSRTTRAPMKKPTIAMIDMIGTFEAGREDRRQPADDEFGQADGNGIARQHDDTEHDTVDGSLEGCGYAGAKVQTQR